MPSDDRLGRASRGTGPRIVAPAGYPQDVRRIGRKASFASRRPPIRFRDREPHGRLLAVDPRAARSRPQTGQRFTAGSWSNRWNRRSCSRSVRSDGSGLASPNPDRCSRRAHLVSLPECGRRIRWPDPPWATFTRVPVLPATAAHCTPVAEAPNGHRGSRLQDAVTRPSRRAPTLAAHPTRPAALHVPDPPPPGRPAGPLDRKRRARRAVLRQRPGARRPRGATPRAAAR